MFGQNLAVLGSLLHNDLDAAVALLRQRTPAPEDFAAFVDHHRVSHYVCTRLSHAGLRSALPPQWVDYAERAAVRQRTRQEHLVGTFLEVAAMLDDWQQEFMLLKGPYVAERFFGGVDRRAFSDLDLLIRRRDLDATARILRGGGFERRSTILLSTALTARFTHAFDFARPPVMLDVHWCLSLHPSFRIDDAALWQHRGVFTMRGRSFSVLSDEDEVMFGLLSIFKDLDRGSCRVRSLVDLYVILEQLDTIDWEAFFEHRARERTRQIAAAVLQLFFRLLDCEGRFPDLAAVLGRVTPSMTLPLADAEALFEAAPGAWRNKQWAARVYECSAALTHGWWAVSLPFRLAVYHPGKYARFRRRLSAWADRVRAPAVPPDGAG